jgi:hypothetical protein
MFPARYFPSRYFARHYWPGPGVAVVVPPPPGTPPVAAHRQMLMLSWSDDRGKTWSHEHWVTSGPKGAYRQRAIWRRLGAFPARIGRIFRVVQTDAIPTAWIDAYVQRPEDEN